MQSPSFEESFVLGVHPRHCGGSLAILAGTPNHADLLEDLRRVVRANPVFASKPHASGIGIGRTRWEPDSRFDVSYHFRWETLPNDADLFPTASQRLAQPLDRGHAPWELHVLTGRTRSQMLVKVDPVLQDVIGQRGLLTRLVDHARGRDLGRAGNGSALLSADLTRQKAREAIELLMSSAAALSESASDLASAAREALVSPSDLAQSALRTARSVGLALAERLTDPPPSLFNQPSHDRRSFALLDLPLAALEAARASLGLELDAVLLSITSGALAQIEREHGGSTPDVLRALVALPRRPQAAILLPIGEADPVERASLLRETLATLARTPPFPAADAVANAITALPRALARRLRPADVAECSVSLRYEPNGLAGAALAGSKVLRAYPFNGTRKPMSVSIGAQPFGRWLSLGLQCDPAAASPRRLLAALRGAAGELISAAGENPQRLPAR